MNKKILTGITSLLAMGALASCTGATGPVNPIHSTTSTIPQDTKTTTQTEAVASTDTTTDVISTTTESKLPDEPVELTIIEMNDLHGYAYESSKSSPTNKIDLASASYYVNQVRSQKDYDNVLLVANGDMFQGTAFSNLSYGQSVIEAMNPMGFDFMGIGNHEFDWGLDKILNYFDTDTANGEAAFPLINGNVNYAKGNSLGEKAGTRVGEANTKDNILPYTILDKGGIKVGILSYIGPLKNDINQTKLFDYTINCMSTLDSSFFSLVEEDANRLKELGADIIVLNTHNGTSGNTGIQNDDFDNAFAEMKDSNGNYLIDAVINGHTHSYQKGVIRRADGVDMPVVQGGSYGNAIGEITLQIDNKTKKVTKILKYDYSYIDSVNPENNKDEQVTAKLNTEYDKIKDLLNQVYCVNLSYADRNAIGQWTVNVMKKYANADIAFMNTGGIRASMNACNVTINELYEINPFDNTLIYVQAKGSEIKDFYNGNGDKYYFDSDFDVSDIEDNITYNIITIDYVYYSTYFSRYFKTSTLCYAEQELCARDLMKLDLIAKKSTGLDLSTSTAASLKADGWKSK